MALDAALISGYLRMRATVKGTTNKKVTMLLFFLWRDWREPIRSGVDDPGASGLKRCITGPLGRFDQNINYIVQLEIKTRLSVCTCAPMRGARVCSAPHEKVLV